jgi:hypothetical protein
MYNGHDRVHQQKNFRKTAKITFLQKFLRYTTSGFLCISGLSGYLGSICQNYNIQPVQPYTTGISNCSIITRNGYCTVVLKAYKSKDVHVDNS